MNQTETNILNIKQVAEIFNVEETTVRFWARNKMIPCFKIGKFWFFNKEEINALGGNPPQTT